MKVTIFKNITETKEPFYLPIEKVVERIKSGNSKKLINKVRQSFTKKDRRSVPEYTFMDPWPRGDMEDRWVSMLHIPQKNAPIIASIVNLALRRNMLLHRKR